MYAREQYFLVASFSMLEKCDNRCHKKVLLICFVSICNLYAREQYLLLTVGQYSWWPTSQIKTIRGNWRLVESEKLVW